MMCKKFGPRKWCKYNLSALCTLSNVSLVTFLTVSFGLCTTCMAAMQNYGGFVGARFVLGALEAGLSPGSAYTLSCLSVSSVVVPELRLTNTSYTRTELASRLGLNASVAAVA